MRKPILPHDWLENCKQQIRPINGQLEITIALNTFYTFTQKLKIFVMCILICFKNGLFRLNKGKYRR